MILNKKVLFIQQAGEGDIMFLQGAAHYFNSLGYHVYWPVLSQLIHIKDYLKKHKISWIEQGKEPNIKYDEIIDFQSADRYFDGSVLEAKYKLIGVDFRDWANYLVINRNFKKEEELFNKLNLEGKKYTLINKSFGTRPNIDSKEIYIEGNNEIVEIRFLDGFTLFDWCKVIEEADQISIVDTSFNYIIETLNLKASKMFLTSRFTPANFKDIQNLFTEKWTKIQT